MKSVMFNLEFEVDFQILVFDVDVHFVFQKKSNTLFKFPLTYTMSSLSSLVATAQASVLQCEATLKAVETALGQAREDLSRVRTALDMTLSTLSPRDVWRPETPGPRQATAIGQGDHHRIIKIDKGFLNDIWSQSDMLIFFKKYFVRNFRL